jgi:hypothetical protein
VVSWGGVSNWGSRVVDFPSLFEILICGVVVGATRLRMGFVQDMTSSRHIIRHIKLPKIPLRRGLKTGKRDGEGMEKPQFRI